MNDVWEMPSSELPPDIPGLASDKVVDAAILCGEDHPRQSHVRCALEADHGPPCRGLDPRTGVLRTWRPVADADRLADELDLVAQLLADFATPVPAGVKLTAHLSAVLRSHVDQAAELIRTRQVAEAADDALKRVRYHVVADVDEALADVRRLLEQDHPEADDGARQPDPLGAVVTGDPDPTPPGPEMCCSKSRESHGGWSPMCTRQPHPRHWRHIAGNGSTVLAVWTSPDADRG